jgi:hypothetical protein
MSISNEEVLYPRNSAVLDQLLGTSGSEAIAPPAEQGSPQ